MPITQSTAIKSPGITTNAHTMLVVSFDVGAQEYALPIDAVVQVVRLPALTELAGAPPAVMGLLNMRGAYLPVLDSRRLLGAQAEVDLNKQVIIAGQRAENGELSPRMGLLVDRVHDVHTLVNERIVALDQRNVTPFLRGIIHLHHRSLLLFDEAALIAEAAVAAG
jgi:purine-binding chemotaxis protein CheW